MYWSVCPCQCPDSTGSSSLRFARASSSSTSRKKCFQIVLCCSQELCLPHELTMPSVTQAQVPTKRQILLKDFMFPSHTPVSLALCSVAACTWSHCSLFTQFADSSFNGFVSHHELAQSYAHRCPAYLKAIFTFSCINERPDCSNLKPNY